MKRLRNRNLFRRSVYVFMAAPLVSCCGALTLTSVSAGAPRSSPEVARHQGRAVAESSAEASPAGVLRFMTLNVAHGRSDGPNQIFLREKRIRSNLDAVARVLSRVRPDVVALQEADKPSFWSGQFDHVEYLASRAGFEYSAHGAHVDGMRISYGTALLSTRNLEDTLSVTFDPTPPTFSKGFLVSTLDWPNKPGFEVDVVSVHLDFSREAVRRNQVATMIAELAARKRPLIVMGDFNCDWKREEAALRILADRLGLRSFQPEATNLCTFPSRGTRLDWILVSPQFQFRKYEVLSDTVSDHVAVVAEIDLADEHSAQAPR